ncbi:transcriptional regulator [Streptomyces sp. NRRL WC-3618]|uniref:helix-turn-helix domain-containing protein n=1 Tax=Streptomyces sp. NRRL WC-3618 TaxID=1519490 RepID=UPI0006AECBD7|nr:helix-turn-helix transcriptional regulator [Streptomyces sp. NRRL WC-3618]KOV87314.1 transcriptional regulator [Streptomyces sp. NRRL WC-3618]
MVRTGHRAGKRIPDVGFAAPVGTPAGVEVLSLAVLRERAPVRLGKGRITLPQRPDFHHLITLSEGRLRHTVDFTGYTLEPGAWLWVRPGQVQQWGDLEKAEGTLILFERDFLDPATVAAAGLDERHAPPLLTPVGEDRSALEIASAHLEHEFHALGRVPLEAHVLILRQLLGALVLRAAHIQAPASLAPDPGEPYVRFRAAVDRDFASVRRVEDYAHALGYSARTLSRATLAADGVTAKEFIDRRVLLEAKRLLAHSDQSAARIAAQLGFSSATNFSKFFHRHTGKSPLGFRGTIRGTQS